MPRSEFARRISAMDPGHLSRVATRHFWDKVRSTLMVGYFGGALGPNALDPSDVALQQGMEKKHPGRICSAVL